MTKRRMLALSASICFMAAGGTGMSGSHAATTVPMVADGLSGVVTSAKGPEAGVWVIAETKDLPTRYIKIVVTDDQGRYVVPELPKGQYKVWVRGYGLVDSRPVTASLGQHLDLTAVLAPDAKAAAQYYPPNYWYSLLRVPPASEFPGTGKSGNGIAPVLKTQQHWLAHLKEDCGMCHQQGDQATRELADNSLAGWEARLQMARAPGDQAIGNTGKSASFQMENNMAGFGRDRGYGMFADWTKRIAAGELPAETPPRPSGVERNVVITEMDWGNGRFMHDIAATDRRDPKLHPNGPVYGVGTFTGTIQILDPVKKTNEEIPIPGYGTLHDVDAFAHTDVLDSHGRLWVTGNSIPFDGKLQDGSSARQPDFCTDKADPFANYYPRPGGREGDGDLMAYPNRSTVVTMYDPATKKVTSIPDCFHSHHLNFAGDKDDTLFFSGDGHVIGWIDTKVWDQTHDARKSQGWCPMVLDTKEKGFTKAAFGGDDESKITPDRKQWNEFGSPLDPLKDTRISGFLYGMEPSPKDGSVWFAKYYPYVPSGIVRFERGSNPPETCKSEYYEPPKLKDGSYAAFGVRGVSVDGSGIVWVSFASGQMGRFDRGKCKVRNGPAATGQQCPDGWTLYDSPGPKVSGISRGSADFHYVAWVDRYDTLGLGKDTPMMPGSNSDSLLALQAETGKFVTMRVPYPRGFYTRGMDGRIDDPNAGWKGRGVWATFSDVPVWHQEGGDEGVGPELVKFQVRPDPLAH
jgi:streptogramin lyase